MLPTFVIGLREGLEASLIVGIIAAFLKQRDRSDLLRWVFAGIASAVVLCAAAGIALDAVSRSLPQRQQEGLETVVGLVAVAMVTYMVVWMKRHSRNLRGQLFDAAGAALAAGTGYALVAMSFLAVLREGLETVVFLLAAFDESGSGSAAAFGAVIGVLTAVALGYAIYRGGVRINLSRFFRVTGVVLVLVAAGLLVNAAHTAHEAGWVTFGQQQTLDLTWLVRPGTVWSSLLTGMLGLQSQPVLLEVLVWFLYLIPVGLYVAWPPGRGPSRTVVRSVVLGGAAITAVTAVLLVVLAPAAPKQQPDTAASGVFVRMLASSATSARFVTNQPGTRGVDGDLQPVRLTARRVRQTTYRGVPTVLYRTTLTGELPGPGSLTLAELAARNQGHLPLGVVTGTGVANGATRVPVSRRETSRVTFWVTRQDGRVLDVRVERRVELVADFAIGKTPVGSPVTTSRRLPAQASSAALLAARHDASTARSRRLDLETAVALAVIAVCFAAAWSAGELSRQRRNRRTTTTVAPAATVASRTDASRLG
jgi:high-affinity iron transporter